MSSDELVKNSQSRAVVDQSTPLSTSDRTALLRTQNRHSYYGSCQGVSAANSIADSELVTALKMDRTISDEDGIVPAPLETPAEQAQLGPMPTKPQTRPQPKKATLLSLAASRGSKTSSAASTGSSETIKLEDIVRKGIDIAREFNASEFTGRQNVIKLEVSDYARRQSMIEFDTTAVRIVGGRGGGNGGYQSDQMSIRSPGEVVIEMPPIHSLDDDQSEPFGCNSTGLDGAAGRWRLRRQRNHSASSKAPLISDV
ncbi:hypothetical protein BOX15_Mlig033854g1 [Macrostomum lignano]|uniref:Uncharacterized protein n=1 Tax=Macrostomum lignano TaxID=282301 RepID=A0A267FU91_9PLAT|nr:hypothetical protein BOX15_Mlig033854g1 [Macrostomum lignano]